MLTIKKRNPQRKLYIFGGTAFIAGFAGVMTLLTFNNAAINQFASYVPPQQTGTNTLNDESDASANGTQSTEADTDKASAATNGASTSNSPWVVPMQRSTNTSVAERPNQTTTTDTSTPTPSAIQAPVVPSAVVDPVEEVVSDPVEGVTPGQDDGALDDVMIPIEEVVDSLTTP